MTPLFASRLSDSGLAFTQVVFHVPLAYAEVIQVMNHAFSSSGSCAAALRWLSPASHLFLCPADTMSDAVILPTQAPANLYLCSAGLVSSLRPRSGTTQVIHGQYIS